jgi:DNA-binding NarL/FixJ family response regulator
MIVDEHPAFRLSVRGLLDRSGFAICAEASDAHEAIAAAKRESPDLCVVDIQCDGGATAVREICTASPKTAVVVLTASRDHDDFFDAVRAGAVGYLLKDMNAERLAGALHGVLAGEAAIPRTLVAALVSELRSQGRRQLVIGRTGRADLTRREWEVAHLLVGRLSTNEIAQRLFLSPVTVRRHVSSVMSKLGVRDREAAVALLEGPGGF